MAVLCPGSKKLEGPKIALQYIFAGAVSHFHRTFELLSLSRTKFTILPLLPFTPSNEGFSQWGSRTKLDEHFFSFLSRMRGALICKRPATIHQDGRG